MLVDKAYVRIPEGQIHYARVAGEGAPVIFIHKTVSTYRMWLPVMERLGGRHEMIAFDTPGFGESFDPAEEVPMAQYAAWLMAAIRALGIERFHIVGHHTGACIALDLAAQNPEAILSLGMIGPAPLSDETRAYNAGKYGPPFAPTDSGGYLLDNWAYIRWAGADDKALANREMSAMLRSWQTRSWAYAAVWKQDFADIYKAIDVPLAIQCAPDDVLWDAFQTARELRPDALVTVLSGGKNYETDLVPDEVAAGIAAQVAQGRK